MAERPARMEVLVEDAQIIWRNFAGSETMYNREGDRNFHVKLPEDVAQKMLADGWNVKFREPKDEDEEGEGFWHIQVAVSFKNFPPKVVLIAGKRRTFLDDSTVEVLDFSEILMVDLIFNSYAWTMASGKTGIKAYLKTMFVTIRQDALEEKYALEDDEAAHDRED